MSADQIGIMECPYSRLEGEDALKIATGYKKISRLPDIPVLTSPRNPTVHLASAVFESISVTLATKLTSKTEAEASSVLGLDLPHTNHASNIEVSCT